ncbi:MAG: hypothetical protein AAGD08_15990 [Pseudomonadota bacterium]
MSKQVLRDGLIVTVDGADLQPSLASARANRIRDVEDKKAQAFKAGVQFTVGSDTKRFRVHPDRTQILLALVSQIDRGRGLPDGASTVPFEATDETIVQMTASQIEGSGGFADTYTAFVASAETAPITHIAAIKALTSVSAVLAYDITTGWPA